MIDIGASGILDAILHIIFATIAIMLIYPRWKNHIKELVILAVVMEFVIDGAHLVNKNITHNIFFLVEFPLIAIFAGYITKERKILTGALLILANTWTHLIMDLFYEGDTLALYYPIYSTEYSAHPAGFLHGMIIWLLILMPIAILLRFKERKTIQPLSLPPYPSGR